MRKIIEVIEKDNGVICFNTDLKMIDIVELPVVAGRLAYYMMTRLWGGNEKIVLAVIRNLAIADLAVSYNRKDMIKMLDQASSETSRLVHDTIDEMKKNGWQITELAPGVKPPKQSN